MALAVTLKSKVNTYLDIRSFDVKKACSDGTSRAETYSGSRILDIDTSSSCHLEILRNTYIDVPGIRREDILFIISHDCFHFYFL